MELMNKHVIDSLKSLNCEIDTKTNDLSANKYFAGVHWWTITYKFMIISVYYDPSDIMGSVGVPYYESYYKEANRYIANNEDNYDNFINDIKALITQHDIDVEIHPETWL